MYLVDTNIFLEVLLIQQRREVCKDFLNATMEDIFISDFYKRDSFDVPYSHGMLHLGKKTYVMGILNVTPDSFYDGSRHEGTEAAVDHALGMIEEGADIVDVGGESTRPGAEPVSEAEELSRVIPVIKNLSRQTRIPVSIDTYKAKVAEEAINAGASIINDVGGLRMDERMARVVAGTRSPVVIMHKKGMPATMQRRPMSDGVDVVSEIASYLRDSVSIALDAGTDRDKIILDPGIGFGKTSRHNLEILKRLREFHGMGFPLLIGASRKKFIGDVLQLPVEGRLYGSLATLAVAVMQGAHAVRVHDVRESVQVAAMCDAIVNA